jgi:HAD superfamily hydrolase (TIGR01459 family)
MTPAMQELAGFAPLAARYDGFIIDLWGVVHDGVTPYPGAIDCLARLRDAGKPAVLLSNAPRRAAAARDGLRAMGIDDGLYAGILTSGEATHAMLRDRTDPWFAALGQHVFHLGPDRDRNVLDGLPLHRVDTAAEAAFVLNTGPDDELGHDDVSEYEPVLQMCARHRLPMICANPDLEVIRGGRRVICAGALALRYQALGGDVRSLGKPDPAIYAPVLDMLGLPRERVLAVGDGLRTDIAGAAAAGIDACWVLGGIHGHQEGHAEIAQAQGLAPLASIPAFRWGSA